MTQQAKPHLYFHEQEYLIIKISDKYAFSDFFKPKDYGFSPFCTDTSCWSGFKCQYSILDNNLFITNVEINESTEFKPLNRPLKVRPKNLILRRSVFSCQNIVLNLS